MLSSRSLFSTYISSSLKCFSSSTSNVLKVGDILSHTRIFTSEDVLEYSKPGAIYVSQSLNFKLPVYVGEKIIGQVEAFDFREYKKRYLAKFKTKCLRNGDELVLEGDASAILPSDCQSSDR